jgi:hypothetical protein
MFLLKNIKQTLHHNPTKKHFYEGTGMEFTVRALPPHKKGELSSVVNSNPLQEKILTPAEKEFEQNVILFANGIEEFKGDEELAREYLMHPGLGESNRKILFEIKKLNPPLEERVKDLFIVLAFSPEEVKLVASLLDVDAKKELVTYLADNENVIEAVHFCKEFFTAFGTAVNLSQEHKVAIEHACLILAKPILMERELLPKEELSKWPDMPQPNVNVNVQQPR